MWGDFLHGKEDTSLYLRKWSHVHMRKKFPTWDDFADGGVTPYQTLESILMCMQDDNVHTR